MQIAQRREDFQQRMIAASFPVDPSLEIASQLFPEESAKTEVNDEGDKIMFPTNEEEFEEMLKLMGA